MSAPCQVAGFGHHSDDIVTVWHGMPGAMRICGKHEQQLGAHAFRVWRHIIHAPEGYRYAGHVDVCSGEYVLAYGTGSRTTGTGDRAAALDAARRHGFEIGDAWQVFLIHDGQGETAPLYERDWSLAP